MMNERGIEHAARLDPAILESNTNAWGQEDLNRALGTGGITQQPGGPWARTSLTKDYISYQGCKLHLEIHSFLTRLFHDTTHSGSFL